MPEQPQIKIPQGKAEPYAAIPEKLMEDVVNVLRTRPFAEVEHVLVPMVYGGAIVRMAMQRDAVDPPPPAPAPAAESEKK